MVIKQLFNKLRHHPEPIAEMINKIKNGDHSLKEELINDYQPFILKTVAKTTGKHVDLANDETYSIGLIAFNEAIESYDESRQVGFLCFAELVIKRRVIDFLRSNQKNQQAVLFSQFDDDKDEVENNHSFENKYLKVEAKAQFEQIEIKEEIAHFSKRIGEFGISFQNLVESAPKHLDSKRLCIKIARILAEDRQLAGKLEQKKNIPMTDLMKRVDVNHKTIERNRKFIIAVYCIINSKLADLQEYVANVEEGGKTHD